MWVKLLRYQIMSSCRHAVGAVCENGNAVASLRENGDDVFVPTW